MSKNKINKIKREDLVQELKMLVLRKSIKMLRIVAKFGARSKPRLMMRMMVQVRNGLKVIHRINIFEKIVLYYISYNNKLFREIYIYISKLFD